MKCGGDLLRFLFLYYYYIGTVPVVPEAAIVPSYTMSGSLTRLNLNITKEVSIKL